MNIAKNYYWEFKCNSTYIMEEKILRFKYFSIIEIQH